MFGYRVRGKLVLGWLKGKGIVPEDTTRAVIDVREDGTFRAYVERPGKEPTGKLPQERKEAGNG